MKLLTFLSTAALFTTAAHAATTITETFSLSSPTTIPDGDLNGLVQSITPVTTITTIDSVTITIQTTGGWNGDLYAYLWHGGEISILMNRIGRTAMNDAGTASSGLDIIFDLTAAADIHSAPAGFGMPQTGTFQPDGRNIHPDFALDTTPRTAGLEIFTGDAAAGEWRLYLADVATGDEATLTSWSLSITGEAIPEPSTSLLGAMAALGLLIRRRR